MSFELETFALSAEGAVAVAGQFGPVPRPQLLPAHPGHGRSAAGRRALDSGLRVESPFSFVLAQLPLGSTNSCQALS